MGIVEDIENKVKDYLDDNYKIVELTGIPTIDNISFGKTAYKFNLTTFSIDLRSSSKLLFDHNTLNAGKIHKAFLIAIAKTVIFYGGKIRDFQGDSILAFWGADYKSEICSAVKAAFAIRWLFSKKLKSSFEKFTILDYGIGIDWGVVHIIRAGERHNPNYNDLVYMGKSVNFAVAIANQAKSPNNLEISKRTYNNLSDKLIYQEDTKGNKINRWSKEKVEWNERDYSTYYTNYIWQFPD